MTGPGRSAVCPAPQPRPPVAGGPAHWGRVLDRFTVATALLIGALALAAWPVVLAAAGPGLPVVGILAHVCGMLAGYGVLVLLFLESRWPPLERGVGSDVLARWHGWGGRAVIGLVLVHAWGAIAAWAQGRGEGLLTGTWQVLLMPAIPAATVGTGLMVVIGAMSVRAARRRVRRETWHGMHLLMYVAVALSFAHTLAGPDLTGHLALQIGWALAYVHVFALVLRHRVLTPPRQAARHRFRVAGVRKLSL